MLLNCIFLCSSVCILSNSTITYVPSNLNTPLPDSPFNGQDPKTRYYYVKYYQDFINMVNKTLKQLWTATLYPPYIEFSPDTFQFIFNIPANEFLIANTLELYFNTRLFNLFSGLPFIFVGYDGELNYKVNVAGSSQNTRQILAADGITKIPFIQIFFSIKHRCMEPHSIHCFYIKYIAHRPKSNKSREIIQ